MENMNLTEIKTADEYNKTLQDNLKLNIPEEEYLKLKEDLGIAKKEQYNREKAAKEESEKHAQTVRERSERPLDYNCDLPFFN